MEKEIIKILIDGIRDVITLVDCPPNIKKRLIRTITKAKEYKETQVPQKSIEVGSIVHSKNPKDILSYEVISIEGDKCSVKIINPNDPFIDGSILNNINIKDLKI